MTSLYFQEKYYAESIIEATKVIKIILEKLCIVKDYAL